MKNRTQKSVSTRPIIRALAWWIFVSRLQSAWGKVGAVANLFGFLRDSVKSEEQRRWHRHTPLPNDGPVLNWDVVLERVGRRTPLGGYPTDCLISWADGWIRALPAENGKGTWLTFFNKNSWWEEKNGTRTHKRRTVLIVPDGRVLLQNGSENFVTPKEIFSGAKIVPTYFLTFNQKEEIEVRPDLTLADPLRGFEFSIASLGEGEFTLAGRGAVQKQSIGEKVFYSLAPEGGVPSYFEVEVVDGPTIDGQKIQTCVAKPVTQEEIITFGETSKSVPSTTETA